MDPATIALLIGFATKYGIPAAIKIAELFHKKEATTADVVAAFSAAHTAYEDYEALPPGSTVPPLPPP